jgi:hypothetical protein
MVWEFKYAYWWTESPTIHLLYTPECKCIQSCEEYVDANTCVICSVVVRILAMGLQHTGSVSSRVGRACVRNGFMYWTSKSAHIRASHALSFSLFPPPFSRDGSAISYKQRGSWLQNNLPCHIISMINPSDLLYNNTPTISYLNQW